MTERPNRTNQDLPPAREYLISPTALRNLFVGSWVVAVLILVALLTMTSSKDQSRYTPADEDQYQATLQSASATISEPGVNELGAGRIPIERAMALVAEKGLAEIGTELVTPAPTE